MEFVGLTKEQEAEARAEIRKQNNKKVEQQILKENEREEKINELKKELKKGLTEIAKPLTIISFNRENYNKLFPRNIIETPIETVKLGEHQFEKLEKKDREQYLQAVYETLKNPYLVIEEERENVFGEIEKAHSYSKSFLIDEKTKTFQSVVVNIEGENVSITNHPRQLNNILNKIKRPNQVLYISDEVRSYVEQHTQTSIVQSVVNATRTTEKNPSVLNSNINQLDTVVNDNLIEINQMLNKELNIWTEKSEKDNKRILELTEKIDEQNKTIQKQNQLLYGETKVEVNGITRTCPNGIVEGFAKSVARNDEQNQRIIRQNQKIENLNNYIDRITNTKDSINPNKPEPKDPKSPGDDGMSY